MDSSHTNNYTFFAASHRSGSTLLTELVSSLDLIGRPKEAFYPQNVAAVLRNSQKNPNAGIRDWLPYILEQGSSPNGWFSAKIFAENFKWLSSQIGDSSPEEEFSNLSHLFNDFFPSAKFVWIRRKDKLQQGISLLKALQSGIWHSHQVDKVKSREPYYQREKIQWAIHNIESQERTLEKVFHSLQVVPLEIWYEDFLEDRRRYLSDIFQFVGHPLPDDDLPQLSLKKLRNKQSQVWIDRFHLESKYSSESPQLPIDQGDLEVFSINLLPFGEKILPGSPIEGRFNIKNLLPYTLRFVGNPSGKGRIILNLHTIDLATSDELKIQQLPVPLELESQQEESLLYHFDPPQKPGDYQLAVRVKQSPSTGLPISGSNKMQITVEASISEKIQSVFGDFEFTPDNWYYSSWFGYFYANNYPWILSLDHGWLEFNESHFKETEELLFTDFALGQWSTSISSYPRIFPVEKEPLVFLETRESQRFFKNESGESVVIGTSQNNEES